jgi:hypothetical protein
MSNEDYEWHGERLLKWHSKEAKVIRAFIILDARYTWMDEYFEKAIQLRDSALDVQKGIDIEITEAFLERMHRFKRAACRLRDRLGCSNRAAADSFHERHPHLPSESDKDYYARMSEIGAK